MIIGRKYREYAYEEWKKAMDLHKYFKLGPTKISRILDISEDTVESWLYNGVVPPGAKWIAKPCIELGYMTGTVQGDGNVSIIRDKYEYQIILETIDPEFAITFSRAMARLLDVNYHEPRWSKKRKVWRVQYKSKAFCTWYKKTEKQGLQGFKQFIEHDRDTVRYYLMGLYDSDGNNDGNKQIQLSNTKKKLLKYVQYLLKKYFNIVAKGPCIVHKAGTTMIINGVKTCYKHGCYRIYIGRKEHILKFLEEIGFSIVRKQLGLKKDERVPMEGRYIEPYELVKLGLFKLPFNDNQ